MLISVDCHSCEFFPNEHFSHSYTTICSKGSLHLCVLIHFKNDRTLSLCTEEDEDGEEGSGPTGEYNEEDEEDEDGSEGGEVGLSYLMKEGIQVMHFGFAIITKKCCHLLF